MTDERKFKRYYDCLEIVIPKNNECPLGEENCYDCPHFFRGGTLGGEVWIDCDFIQEEEDY